MATRNKRLEKHNNILVSEHRQEDFENKLFEANVDFYVNPDKPDEYVICGSFKKAQEIYAGLLGVQI